MENEKLYNVEIQCCNCGCIEPLTIPIGVFVKDYLKAEEFICLNCYCKDAQLKTFLPTMEIN